MDLNCVIRLTYASDWNMLAAFSGGTVSFTENNAALHFNVV
jgi:hypothetical protein